MVDEKRTKKSSSETSVFYDDAVVAINNIKGIHPDIMSVGIGHVEITYLMKSAKYVSGELIHILLIQNPIIVTRKDKDNFLALGNVRILEIAAVVLGVDAKIPVRVLRSKSEKIKRLHIVSEIVGRVIVFGMTKIEEIGEVIRRLPKTDVDMLLLGIKTQDDLAEVLRSTRQTMFGKRKQEKIMVKKCDEKENLNDRYMDDGVGLNLLKGDIDE